MAEAIREMKFALENEAENEQAVLGSSVQDKARLALETMDFPTTREEAWKYTRVAKIKNGKFKLNPKHQLSASDLDSYAIPELRTNQLVFVNGYYQKDLSQTTPESGVEVSPMSSASSAWKADFLNTVLGQENQFFNTLNTAHATDGVAIKITKKTQAKQPISCLFITTGEGSYAGIRNLIVCEDFAEAQVVFNFQSHQATACFSHAATEIVVGKQAKLSVDKIQVESDSNYCIAAEAVKQNDDSNFTINTITLDGALVRNDLNIAVDGNNAETNLNGMYVLKGKQHVDNHTTVDHRVAHCNSNELYKGVIDGQATAVFNGKVFVRQDAQKINAFQSNGNVLLSNDASVNSKPELEIYADDVKCSHGSTTGQLDEEAVFYLRARGLSEKSARALLVSAFIGDVVEKIASEPVQAFVKRSLAQQFAWIN